LKEDSGKSEVPAVPRIAKDDFNRLVRIYYKVVKEIVLSDSLTIESAGQLRRMEVGEIVEVYQGPVIDPSVNVYRIHGCALMDGQDGWITVAGNQGITFLQPGGHVFKVVQQCALTEDLQDLSGEKTVRTLSQGEMLEVLGWARTANSPVGITRLQVRAHMDSARGWVTIRDSAGTTLLEAT